MGVFNVTVWICLSESDFSASFSVCPLFTVGTPSLGLHSSRAGMHRAVSLWKMINNTVQFLPLWGAAGGIKHM